MRWTWKMKRRRTAHPKKKKDEFCDVAENNFVLSRECVCVWVCCENSDIIIAQVRDHTKINYLRLCNNINIARTHRMALRNESVASNGWIVADRSALAAYFRISIESILLIGSWQLRLTTQSTGNGTSVQCHQKRVSKFKSQLNWCGRELCCRQQLLLPFFANFFLSIIHSSRLLYAKSFPRA